VILREHPIDGIRFNRMGDGLIYMVAIRQPTGLRYWPDTVHFITLATSLQKTRVFYSYIFSKSTNSRKGYTNNERWVMRNKTFAILNGLRTHVPHNIITQKLYRSVS